MNRLSRDVRIQQAIAFGRSTFWMLTNMRGVTTADIEKARRHMDEAVADDPWVLAGKVGAR